VPGGRLRCAGDATDYLYLGGEREEKRGCLCNASLVSLDIGLFSHEAEIRVRQDSINSRLFPGCSNTFGSDSDKFD